MIEFCVFEYTCRADCTIQRHYDNAQYTVKRLSLSKALLFYE